MVDAGVIQSNIFTKQPRKECINKTVIELWGSLARSIFDRQNLKLFCSQKDQTVSF